jgi:hypothetical protein
MGNFFAFIPGLSWFQQDINLLNDKNYEFLYAIYDPT